MKKLEIVAGLVELRESFENIKKDIEKLNSALEQIAERQIVIADSIMPVKETPRKPFEAVLPTALEDRLKELKDRKIKNNKLAQ